MTDLQALSPDRSLPLSQRRRTLLFTMIGLSVLISGCSTYSSKFRTVVAKIKQDKLFQSLDATLRYKLEGGDSEVIPYRAVVHLEYVDTKTDKKVVHRCLYHYTLTWEEGKSRDWNWALVVIDHQLPSGEWVLSRDVLTQPEFIKMLRP